MNRRAFLLSGGAAIAFGIPIGPVEAWVHGNIGARKMQLGLQGVSYFTGFSPFLNWWYGASAPTVFQATGGIISDAAMWTTGNASGAPYFDALTGDVKIPFNSNMTKFSRLIFQGNANAQCLTAIAAGGGNYAAQTMIADCNSQWTITISLASLGAGGSVSGNGTNSVTFTIGNGSDAAPLMQVVPVGTPTVPPAPRVYKQQLASRINAGQMFDPDWLAIVSPFRTLRYMDWPKVNNSVMTDYSQLATAGYQYQGQPFTTATGVAGVTGFVAGMPLDTICALANLTGTEIHYCLPVQATDACVQSIATFFKASTSQVVTYEFSNECWNTGFTQTAYCAAQALLVPGNPWGGDAASTRSNKWYGYRSTAAMALIKAVYNDRSRWRGGMATQSVNTVVTNNILTGANYYLANVVGSGVVADYFNDLFVTSYIGEVQSAQQPSNITQANPGVVTLNAHGKNNGDVIKIFSGVTTFTGTISGTSLTASGILPTSLLVGQTIVGAGVAAGTVLVSGSGASWVVNNPQTVGPIAMTANSMTQLNDTYATVANKTANTFELQGIDTSGYYAYVNSTRSFIFKALIFQIMDQSLANFGSNPALYPTKYTYFNQQIAVSIQTGTSASGFTTSTTGSLAGQNDPMTGSWKLQHDIAVANGLLLRQYEGGPNWTGDAYLGGFSGGASPQYNEYFLNLCWSAEIAAVMSATYTAFATYGDRSAKFTEGGLIGVVNPWAGMRTLPQDNSNPGWLAVTSWNYAS